MGCTPPEKHQEIASKTNVRSENTLSLPNKKTTTLETSKKVDKHEIRPKKRTESFLPLESAKAY